MLTFRSPSLPVPSPQDSGLAVGLSRTCRSIRRRDRFGVMMSRDARLGVFDSFQHSAAGWETDPSGSEEGQTGLAVKPRSFLRSSVNCWQGA